MKANCNHKNHVGTLRHLNENTIGSNHLLIVSTVTLMFSGIIAETNITNTSASTCATDESMGRRSIGIQEEERSRSFVGITVDNNTEVRKSYLQKV